MANNISKNLLQEVKSHNETKLKLKQRDNEYKELEAKYHAVVLALQESEDKHKLLQKGATLYWESNGYVYNAITIDGYFNHTYPQVLPYHISTTIYKKYPFYKMVNGKLEIDNEQYKKYKGAILL